MESDWLSTMPETVTVVAYIGHDRYSDPLPGATPKQFRCRLEQTSKEIRGQDGLVRVAATVIFPWKNDTTGAALVLTERDKFTLPDGATPPVLAVERVDDELGFHHYEVYLAHSVSNSA